MGPGQANTSSVQNLIIDLNFAEMCHRKLPNYFLVSLDFSSGRKIRHDNLLVNIGCAITEKRDLQTIKDLLWIGELESEWRKRKADWRMLFTTLENMDATSRPQNRLEQKLQRSGPKNNSNFRLTALLAY